MHKSTEKWLKDAEAFLFEKKLCGILSAWNPQ